MLDTTQDFDEKGLRPSARVRRSMGRNRKAAAEEEDAPTDLKWRPDAVDEGQTRGAAAKQRAKELRKAKTG